MKIAALTLCTLLVPVSAVLADDEETQTLHSNTYQVRASVTCQYPGDCAVFFPATTHITTVVTNASCSYAVPSGTTTQGIVIQSEAFDAGFVAQPFFRAYSGGSALYGFNTTLNLYLSKGGIPRIDVSSIGGPVSYLDCTISGYHS